MTDEEDKNLCLVLSYLDDSINRVKLAKSDIRSACNHADDATFHRLEKIESSLLGIIEDIGFISRELDDYTEANLASS